MPTPPFANLTAVVAAIDELVPDMKGAYDEAGFVLQGIARLSDSQPAVESVDVGDGTTREWVLPGATSADPFYRYETGFSDRWPLEIEQLTTGDVPSADAEEYSGRWRVEDRTVSGSLKRYLIFATAPATAAKARVRFRRPWIVRNVAGAVAALVEVPKHYQMALVYFACAEKCDALAALYRSSIDPSGGSDIFDARQYADSYETKADKFRDQAAGISGVGDDEQSFSAGTIHTGEVTVFPRGHDTGLLD